MSRVGIYVNNTLEKYDAFKCADAVKKAGFKDVLVAYTHDSSANKYDVEVIKYCKSIGLNPFFAHLFFNGCNDIWVNDESGDKLIADYKKDIKELSQLGIEIVCIHLTSKFVAPEYNELGLARIRDLNDFCKSLNIKLSLENTKIKGYQEYVMSNIQDDNLGICIDTGHVHCHFKDDYNFDLFDKRISSLHIHDNNGIDDQHYLPYDGSIDWDKYMAGIKNNHFDGVYTLEVMYSNKYHDMDIDEYHKLAFERVNKLVNL